MLTSPFEVARAQPKPSTIAPAEKLKEGWEVIDERLNFLMVRLANTEASLDAVEKAIFTITGKKSTKAREAKRYEAGNDRMDRQGGGPMRWSEFYGRTADKFFYHPTDRNSSCKLMACCTTSAYLLQKWSHTLKELEQQECPFANLTNRSALKGAVWLRPELAARVRFQEFTDVGQLRHASLLSIHKRG